jgi:hypothetical protein
VCPTPLAEISPPYRTPPPISISLPRDPISPAPPLTATSPAIASHHRPGLRIRGVSSPLPLLLLIVKHPTDEGCARSYVPGGWSCGRSNVPSRLAPDFDPDNLPLAGNYSHLLRPPPALRVEPSPPTPYRFTHAFLSSYSSAVLPYRDFWRRENCMVCRCKARQAPEGTHGSAQ